MICDPEDPKNMLRYLVSVFFLSGMVLTPALRAQSFNYWTRNFNEESSLASGAVVGGGAGPSAIYYNPAAIGENSFSQLSIHASLFSMNLANLRNALGNGVDLNSIRLVIEPRFISYMIKPHEKWNLEFAFLNNENYFLTLNTAVDMPMDLLRSLPGEERYFARFQYYDRYRDDWVGIGGSYAFSSRLRFGLTLMVPVRQLDYNYVLDIKAIPLPDTTGGNDMPYYVASYDETDYVHFNNYRLLLKGGLLYKKKSWSIGLSITSPSINVYSDGKRVAREKSRSNIMGPDTVRLPDYTLTDYAEKKEMKADFKSPFSIAVGATVHLSTEHKQTLYFTSEFFAGIKPYRIVSAHENSWTAEGSEWLTFVNGGKSLINVAVGYNIQLKENVRLMGGFRTDFNSRKNMDLSPFEDSKKIKGLTMDIYRLSGGVIFTFKGQDFIVGLQYSVGREINQEQFANLTEPVEYNEDLHLPLQGDPHYNMDVLINNLNFYFGATFNFNTNK